MQIVIDIPEILYTKIQNGKADKRTLETVILHGTPQQRWIPVSERLPEEETDVIVCSETGAITVCCGSYSTEVSNTFIWYTEGWRFGKVIAWMPLPEPYKAESEEK